MVFGIYGNDFLRKKIFKIVAKYETKVKVNILFLSFSMRLQTSLNKQFPFILELEYFFYSKGK